MHGLRILSAGFFCAGPLYCGGGVGADTFDKLGPLTDWVEHGTAPDAIPASQVSGGKAVRTRLLCAYPEAARYKVGEAPMTRPTSRA